MTVLPVRFSVRSLLGLSMGSKLPIRQEKHHANVCGHQNGLLATHGASGRLGTTSCACALCVSPYVLHSARPWAQYFPFVKRNNMQTFVGIKTVS